MAGDGINLVLRRLAHVGSDPRRASDDTWDAQCPVHGGPYYALLVTRGQDGSVSLNCRYPHPKGTFCPESELWESIGLDPRKFAAGQINPESAAAPDSAASQPSDLSLAPTMVVVSAEPGAHGDVARVEPLPRKDDSHAEMPMRIASKGRIFRGSDNRFY